MAGWWGRHGDSGRAVGEGCKEMAQPEPSRGTLAVERAAWMMSIRTRSGRVVAYMFRVLLARRSLLLLLCISIFYCYYFGVLLIPSLRHAVFGADHESWVFRFHAWIYGWALKPHYMLYNTTGMSPLHRWLFIGGSRGFGVGFVIRLFAVCVSTWWCVGVVISEVIFRVYLLVARRGPGRKPSG